MEVITMPPIKGYSQHRFIYFRGHFNDLRQDQIIWRGENWEFWWCDSFQCSTVVEVFLWQPPVFPQVSQE